MDWLGIGVLVIGIAFVGLVIVLIKPLNNLGNVLFSIQRTTDDLPHNINVVVDQTKSTLQASTEAIASVNKQMNELSPLFHIVGDVGRSTEKLSSKLVDVSVSMKGNTEEGKNFIDRHNLEGLYGALTLGYYLAQKRKASK